MMSLHSNWFTEPVFDFEYKKYQLLAYLQQKNLELSEKRIYPHLRELNEHLASLSRFLDHKQVMDFLFKKELEGIDENTFELKFRSTVNDREELSEFMNIVHYSHREISSCLNDFSAEAEALKKHIHVELAGLLPAYLQDGFLMVFQKDSVFAFAYAVKPVLTADGDRQIHYQYLTEFENGWIHSEQKIKAEIIKNYATGYDHPAVFSVTTDRYIPIYETLLPLTGMELKKWVA